MQLRITETSLDEPSVLVELMLDGDIHQYTVEGSQPHEPTMPSQTYGVLIGNWIFGGRRDSVLGLIKSAEPHTLHIEIRALNPAFLHHRWEALILPGQDSPVSLQCASFCRTFLDAHIIGEGAIRAGQTDDMRVLCVIASGHGAVAAHSDMLSVCIRSLEFDRPVRFELSVDATFEAIMDTIERKEAPIHAVQFEGHCVMRDGNPLLAIRPWGGVPQLIEVEAILKRMSRAGIRLAVVGLEHTDPSVDGLALLGKLSSEVRDLTLIGYPSPVDARTRSADAIRLFGALAAGSTVGRATVDLRKCHQDSRQSQDISANDINPTSRAQLVQYGNACPAMFPLDESIGVERAMAQPFGKIRSRMFGFQATMLPPDNVSSASSAYLALMRTGDHFKLLRLTGEAGVGKTHLAHHLAFHSCAHNDANLAFYFDYGQTFYSYLDIAAMIAPVLGGDTSQSEDIVVLLSSIKCHFVIDSFPERKSLSAEDAETFDKTVALIQRLASKHRVTFAGGHASWTEGTSFEVPPLAEAEIRIIAQDLMARLAMYTEVSAADLARILELSGGNPWQAKKAVTRLLTRPAPEVLDELADISLQSHSSRVAGYHDYQFVRLPSHLQQLLLLMLDFPGVYFEMLLVAQARPESEPPSPARALMEALGAPSSMLSEGIAELESAGFLLQSGFGRQIEPSARSYLLHHRNTAPQTIHPESALALSRLLCESLCIIGPRLQANENQGLAFNIVSNRHHWARCMETLWLATEYQGFFSTRTQLQQLLAVHRVNGEIDEWSHDLICRTDRSCYADMAVDASSTLAWLALARSSVATKARASSPPIAEATEYLFNRFMEVDLDSDSSRPQLALFAQVASFLEGSYYIRGEWTRCNQVSAAALRIGKYLDQPNRIMRSLKSMAKCAAHLQCYDECLKLEEQLMDITYSHDQAIPPRIQLMLGLECLDDRLQRGAMKDAQRLLDLITRSHPEKPLQPLIRRYQADVFFAQRMFAESAEIYGQLKRGCTQFELASAGVEHIDGRISALKMELDEATFGRLFGKHEYGPVSLH